jgi:hypothetical protein
LYSGGAALYEAVLGETQVLKLLMKLGSGIPKPLGQLVFLAFKFDPIARHPAEGHGTLKLRDEESKREPQETMHSQKLACSECARVRFVIAWLVTRHSHALTPKGNRFANNCIAAKEDSTSDFVTDVIIASVLD